MDDSNPPEKKNDLEATPSHDAVFGEITEEGPNYRSVCSVAKYTCMLSLVSH